MYVSVSELKVTLSEEGYLIAIELSGSNRIRIIFKDRFGTKPKTIYLAEAQEKDFLLQLFNKTRPKLGPVPVKVPVKTKTDNQKTAYQAVQKMLHGLGRIDLLRFFKETEQGYVVFTFPLGGVKLIFRAKSPKNHWENRNGEGQYKLLSWQQFAEILKKLPKYR